jgi:hypothetical protein
MRFACCKAGPERLQDEDAPLQMPVLPLVAPQFGRDGVGRKEEMMRHGNDFDEIADQISEAKTCGETEKELRVRIVMFVSLCSSPLLLDVASYINDKMRDEDRDESLRN